MIDYQVWDTNVPVWALLLSVALPVIYILPSGFIYAMTGQGVCVFSHLSKMWWLTVLMIDNAEHSGSNHPRNSPSWETFCKHGTMIVHHAIRLGLIAPIFRSSRPIQFRRCRRRRPSFKISSLVIMSKSHLVRPLSVGQSSFHVLPRLTGDHPMKSKWLQQFSLLLSKSELRNGSLPTFPVSVNPISPAS